MPDDSGIGEYYGTFGPYKCGTFDHRCAAGL